MIENITAYLFNLNEYKKIISIIELALIIREISLSKTFENTETALDESIASIDLDQIRKQMSNKMKEIIKKTYIVQNKLTDHEAVNYLKALNDIINESYSTYPSQTDHFYEHLVNYFPGMTKEIYMKKHRTKFEYLIKSAKQEINTILKKEYFSL